MLLTQVKMRVLIMVKVFYCENLEVERNEKSLMCDSDRRDASSLRLRGNGCAGTDSRRDPCADRRTDSEAHTQAYAKPDTDSQNR